MHYLVGDIQGCDDALERLLAACGFSPSRDRLTVLGDVVNRGPASLAVLERLAALGDAAEALLGNHDLHLLAVAHGVRPAHRSDTLDAVLAAPARARWVDWIRHCPLALERHGWLCVHAGVVPQWDRARTLGLAAEVQTMLRGPDLPGFLRVMYGNEPRRWHDELAGADRLRLIINVLTRIRFCRDDGTLDFSVKDSTAAAPPGHRPWFDIPGRASAGQRIAFGHWSTLGAVDRDDLLALDTGCVWGGQLSAVRVDAGHRDWFQVRCAQSQAPG